MSKPPIHLNVKSEQHNVKLILISEERLKTNLWAILPRECKCVTVLSIRP